MAEEATVTNNPEVTTEEAGSGQDSAIVNDLYVDAGVTESSPTQEKERAGTEESKDDQTVTKEAHDAKDTQASEQPFKYDGELSTDNHEFFKTKGFITDGKIDIGKFTDSYRSVEKKFNEHGQALSGYKSQVSQLQNANVKEEPLTRDDVSTNYQQGKVDIDNITNLLSRFVDGNHSQQDISEVNQYLSDMRNENDSKRDKDITQIGQLEFAKQYGLTPKGDVGLEDMPKILASANDNVINAMTADESKVQNGATVLLQPVIPLLNAIAQGVYPKEYNKGATQEEINQSNNNAISRILADPNMAKFMIESGRALKENQELKSQIKHVERSSYDRGSKDAYRQVNAGTVNPHGSSVKEFANNPSNSDLMKSMHAEAR